MIPIYILIPAVFATLWGVYVKYQQHKIADTIILSVMGIASFVNVLLVYQMIVDEISVCEHLIQMVAASCVIPLAYTYFARQVGRQTTNDTATTLMWLLACFTFVPEIIIYNPFEPFVLPKDEVQPFVIYVLSHGEKTFAIYTGDLVSMLQCLVAVLRIIPFSIMLREHNLHLNKKVYSFMACWALIIVFVLMISTMSMEELRSTSGRWFYLSFYSLLIIYVNVLIALRYDLYPIENAEGEIIEDLSFYVQQQYGDMATRMRNFMEQQQRYLDTQLTAEQVIEHLHTNHTYFSQMMSSEWGMSFSEYLNNLRLAHVERLLHDESLSISAAATQSGFADAGYMSRKFKAKYGVTPTEWRKSL